MEDPQALIQQAEKLVSKGSGGWSFLGGSDDKFWDAARLFKEAAQAYERQGQNIEAGKTYERAATVREKNLKELGDAADSYVEASDAYRRDDPEAAIRCRERAFALIQQSTSESKQTRLSRVKEILGQIYEHDLKDLKRAREAYKEAAERLPKARELNANKLFTQYADLAALDEDYYVAIETYDRIINSMIGNQTMKWSLSTYCFKAGVCHLATGDLVGTRRAIEGYRQKDVEFSSQYKYKLIEDLCGAIEAHDQDQFGEILFQFDRTSRLEPWMTAILVKVKNAIEAPDDEFA
ncbi:probable vesicular-fusion protein sec17 homolog [Trichoderma asperellum]|uniref:Probable vesicular-fusion protein sec17 homolog n=1 Tax=Trichoderma asperellum TaxID=101201 RepID=A0A6V8QP29_TRIAP|nr:soluble NSF attachment protein [Trichoderma asperelloides]GFP54125.1 probable vesicular-fusion protein sec17 homolog [Trichoderma asperellum]